MPDEKCQLGRARGTYLRHRIGQGTPEPIDAKVAAIKDFPRPLTKKDVRSFLGITGYYQHYIPNYSDIASPLTVSLRKREPDVIIWTVPMGGAFEGLKEALTSRPLWLHRISAASWSSSATLATVA